MLVAQDGHRLQEQPEVLSLLGKGAGVEQGWSIMPGRGGNESLHGDATPDDICRTTPICVQRRRRGPRKTDVGVDVLHDHFVESPVRALVPMPLEWKTESCRH